MLLRRRRDWSCSLIGRISCAIYFSPYSHVSVRELVTVKGDKESKDVQEKNLQSATVTESGMYAVAVINLAFFVSQLTLFLNSFITKFSHNRLSRLHCRF